MFGNLEARFTEKIQVDTDDGCWIWTAGKFASGYGQFSIKSHPVRAHRYAYENIVGSIADGLVLDHFRMNPGPWKRCSKACVNPDHMDVVTVKVNTKRGRVGDNPDNGAWNLVKTHCPQGHPYAGDNLYVNKHSGARQCKTCSRARYQSRKKANPE